MNAAMQTQTRHLLIKLGIALILFTLLSSAIAAAINYSKMLTTTIINQEIVVSNMAAMKTADKEVENTLAKFRQHLPHGYESYSPERLIYGRLDELKNSLQAVDMTVKTMEKSNGQLSIDFSASLPLLRPESYALILNQLGRHETLAFPFISVQALTIEQPTDSTNSTIKMFIEGTVETTAPQSVEAPS